MMRYLGGLSGDGMLSCNGHDVARASYAFDGYYKKPMGVTCSGEIRATATALKTVIGRKDVQLLTDDGRLLNLKFSDRKLSRAGNSAHVDVTGQLPDPALRWPH
jgi:hypothetical protein